MNHVLSKDWMDIKNLRNYASKQKPKESKWSNLKWDKYMNREF